MASLVVTTSADTVDANDGVLSLREAITLANANSDADIIKFDASLSGQTVTLTAGELAITEDLTIDGDMDGDNRADITLSGNNTSRILNITGGSTDVSLKSLTITAGFTSGQGGAVYAFDAGTLTIIDTSIENSHADSHGGGLRVYATDLTMVNSLIDHNSTNLEGAGAFITSSTATIINSTFFYNDADGVGGGISAWTSTVSLINSTITNNLADADGSDGGSGGGIYNSGSTFNIANSVVAGNLSSLDFDANDVLGVIGSATNSVFGSQVTITDNVMSQVGVTNLGLDTDLADNGGTVRTIAIIDPNSILIDGGDNDALPADSLDIDGDDNTSEDLPLDGRGDPRISGGTVDIGAVEYKQGDNIGLFAALSALHLAGTDNVQIADNSLFQGDNETIVFALQKPTNQGGHLTLETLAQISQANGLLAAAEAAGHPLDIVFISLDGFAGKLHGLANGIRVLHVNDTGTAAGEQARLDLVASYQAETGLSSTTISVKALHRAPGVDDVAVVNSTEQGTAPIGTASLLQQHIIAADLETALASTGTAVDLVDRNFPTSADVTPVGAYNEVGEIIPDLTFTDSDGEDFSLHGQARGLMVLSICAMWCGPCFNYAKTLADLEARMGSDFQFAEVIVENQTNQLAYTHNADAWRTKFGLDEPVLTTNGDVETLINFTRGIDVRAFPTYIVVDAKTGEIVNRIVGFAGNESFSQTLGDISDSYYSGFKAKNFGGTAKNDVFAGGLGFDTISGRAGSDKLAGAAGNDLIQGGDGNDRLAGDSGDDTLKGNDGDDRIDGGEGDDLILGGKGKDVLKGGAGEDTLSYSDSNAGVAVMLVGAITKGGFAKGDTIAGFENIIGSSHIDKLTGNAVDNVIEGGAGADVMNGGQGNNTVSYLHSSKAVRVNIETNVVSLGDANGDKISNFNNVVGSGFNDNLTGNAADNVLDGGAGTDKISGGDGNDRLIGGKGVDILTGGAGFDTFVLGKNFADRDIIIDFSGDQLAISSLVFGAGLGDLDPAALAAGDMDTTRFVANLTGLADHASDRFIYRTDTGELFFDSNGNASGGNRLIATLDGVPTLTADSFMLF
jgi:CSLREA domain-containing protein